MANVGGGAVGCTGYSDSCGYHSGNFCVDGITYGDVVRSGNTVTVKNLKVNGNFYLDIVNKPPCHGITYGWLRGWAGKLHVWKSSSNTQGTDWIASSGTIDISQGGAVRWYDDPHIISKDTSLGNFSFTVTNTQTSQGLRFGFAFSRNDGGAGTYRDGSNQYISFTVTFPANVKTLDVNGTKDGTATRNISGMGTCDVTVAGRKVGEDVTDYYNTNITYNSSYKVDDIKETSSNYYYTGSSSYSGNLTSNVSVVLPFKSTVAPSGITATLVSRAWNSIVAKATVTSYGEPVSRSRRYVEVGLAPDSATAYGSRVLFQSTSNTTATGNKTFNQSNDSTSFIIAGARSFKIGGYANNTKKPYSVLNSTVYWLPPHPMASVALASTTRNETNVTFKVNMKGAAADNVNNISGAKVNTQYRYSTDGGTTYTAWANSATNEDPATTVAQNITVPYNTAVKFQTRQVTTGDTTQATAALTLDIAAVHPIPKAPTLSISWEELNRIATVKSSNVGNGGASGDATFKRLEIELAWDNGFGTTFLTYTSSSINWQQDVPYLKPMEVVYVRARAVNNWDLESSWTTIFETVPRPIWGLITNYDSDNNKEVKRIRDMVEVHTDGSVSPRDWVEGTTATPKQGKKRIVKN